MGTAPVVARKCARDFETDLNQTVQFGLSSAAGWHAQHPGVQISINNEFVIRDTKVNAINHIPSGFALNTLIVQRDKLSARLRFCRSNIPFQVQTHIIFINKERETCSMAE